MLKEFPKKTVDIILSHLLDKGYSYREIQEIFNDVEGYGAPSLGYIVKFAKKRSQKKK